MDEFVGERALVVETAQSIIEYDEVFDGVVVSEHVCEWGFFDFDVELSGEGVELFDSDQLFMLSLKISRSILRFLVVHGKRLVQSLAVLHGEQENAPEAIESHLHCCEDLRVLMLLQLNQVRL